MAILQAEDLKKYYGSGENLVKALDGVTLEVEKGEFVAIVGTSGSGKSTLLHMLGGLDKPTAGNVVIDGQSILELADDALCIFRRRKIGFVFQNYNLVPSLNVYENIVLPIQLDGREPDKEYLDKIIETLGLSEKLNNLPNNLSGCQQQRVALARALVNNPVILLADEPTGNLDPKNSWEIMSLLDDINKRGTTVVVVTHNQEIVDRMEKRVITLKNGRVISDEEKGRYRYAKN
ncbi:MAG: ABC transporter ATP-binding protein [Lachnospiraceae bacterium]|nr:ABC transporter ATP-binding protein [Lachnospiraceae bacterium]